MTTIFSPFLDAFKKWVRENRPQWAGGLDDISPYLMSPTRVEISRDVYHAMASLAVCLHRLLLTHPPVTEWKPVGVPPLMTSYDFYITADGPRLIEINTNAAGYPLLGLLTGYHQLDDSAVDEHLIRLFREIDCSPIPTIGLVDDQPLAQKTYFEFAMLSHWIQSMGWGCHILDIRDPFPDDITSIYNRYCDFEWATPTSSGLRAWDQMGKPLSPHPWHYVTLAKKTRLIDAKKYLPSEYSNMVPDTWLLCERDKSEWWEARKGLFFKPISGFGSRGVYRGEGMSRGVMDRLDDDTLVQTRLDPIPIETSMGVFKSDFRLYVHGERVMLMGARLFQGQVTNMQTMGGGFAAVSIR